MKIGHSKSCLNTPAFALLTEGWNDLVQDGFTTDGMAVCPLRSTTECFYATNDTDEIVGVLAFDFDITTAVFTVRLAYVEPSSRKTGVFAALFAALKSSVEPGDKIAVPVAAHNKLALDVLSRFGIVPESVCCLLAA